MENGNIFLMLTRDDLKPKYLPVNINNFIRSSLRDDFINDNCDIDNDSLDLDDVYYHKFLSDGYTSNE